MRWGGRKRKSGHLCTAYAGGAVLSDCALNASFHWREMILTWVLSYMFFHHQNLTWSEEKVCFFSCISFSASTREEYRNGVDDMQQWNVSFCWRLWNYSLNKFLSEVQVGRFMIGLLAFSVLKHRSAKSECYAYSSMLHVKAIFFLREINSTLKTAWSTTCFDCLH